ncbi:MAG: hypothetical protein RIQ30_539, partial [Pseudomonadota bacterium]
HGQGAYLGCGREEIHGLIFPYLGGGWAFWGL